MTDSRTDEQLVAGHLGGERAAFAGIYDRYADPLHDTAAAMLRDRHEAADVTHDVFLVAAERLGQLRDASRLKPWLFAILRNEVYRRTKRRSRERPTDLAAPGLPEMAAPDDPGGEGAAIAYQELAESVRSAAAGLDTRDQLVLELSVRQGLTGADLAAALGVSVDQSYVLVHRMRERVERSLGALAVARAGRRDCPELDAILAGWDGTFSVLVRKRVARHVDACSICGDTKRRYGALALFGAAPAMAAPPELRAVVLAEVGAGAGPPPSGDEFTEDGGFPGAPRSGRRGAAKLAAAVAVLVVGAGVATVLSRGNGDSIEGAAAPAASTPAVAPAPTVESVMTTIDAATATGAAASTTATPGTTIPVVLPTAAATLANEPTTTTSPPPPPAPGRLELSSAVVDLGATDDVATLTLTNTGGSPVGWTLDDGGDPAPFAWTAVVEPLAAGASEQIQFAIDRTQLPEGEANRAFAVTADAPGGGSVEVRAQVERPPDVRITQGQATLACPWSASPFVGVAVEDESALASVVLSWTGPGSSGSGEMSPAGDGWTGRLDIDRVDGTWTYAVTATDERGNAGTASGSIEVDGC